MNPCDHPVPGKIVSDEYLKRYAILWGQNAPFEIGDTVRLSGKRADYIVIDDYHNQTESKVTKATKKAYNTVGVRFLRGGALDKAYTYRVPKKARLHLGQEVIVPSDLNGFVANTLGVVVDIHKTPQDIGSYEYKFVTGTVRPL